MKIISRRRHDTFPSTVFPLQLLLPPELGGEWESDKLQNVMTSCKGFHLPIFHTERCKYVFHHVMICGKGIKGGGRGKSLRFRIHSSDKRQMFHISLDYKNKGRREKYTFRLARFC